MRPADIVAMVYVKCLRGVLKWSDLVANVTGEATVELDLADNDNNDDGHQIWLYWLCAASS